MTDFVTGEQGHRILPSSQSEATPALRTFLPCPQCDGAPGEVQAGCRACGGYGRLDRACEFDLVDERNVVRAWGGTDRAEAEKKAAELGLTVVENWRG